MVANFFPLVFALCHLAGTVRTAPACVAADDTLRARIVARAAQVQGATIGVAFHDLEAGDSFGINADDSFHAASTMKVPVMIELFRRIDSGALTLEQGIPLTNQFRSIVDGSPFVLDPAVDSDSSAYPRVGSRVPLRELI